MAQRKRIDGETIDPGALFCLAKRHWWVDRPNLVTDVGIFGSAGRGGEKIAEQCEHCDSLHFIIQAKSTGVIIREEWQQSAQFRAALDELGRDKPAARKRWRDFQTKHPQIASRLLEPTSLAIAN